MPTPSKDFDITLKTNSGTETGYNLARRNGKPVWDMQDVSYFPPNYTVGQPGVTDTPPSVATPIYQGDFTGGIGESLQNTGKGYWMGAGIDASIPGRVFPGPYKTDESFGALTITNGGFETALGAEWTVLGGFARNAVADAATSNEGEHYVAATGAGGKQTWSGATVTALRGKTLVVTCATQDAVGGAATAHMSLADGTSTDTADSSGAGGGVYQGLSVSITVDAAATDITLTLYVTGANQCYFDSVVAGVPKCFARYNGVMYVSRGARVETWVAGVVTESHVLLHEVSDLKVYGIYLLAACGSKWPYAYYDPATSAWVDSTLAGVKACAELFGVVGTTLYKAVAGGLAADPTASQVVDDISTSTNPTNAGDWAATTAVGMPQHDINGLPNGVDVFLCKENGVYSLDTGVPYLYADLKDEEASTSGKWAVTFGGVLINPCGTVALKRITEADVIYDIGPCELATDNSVYRLRVKAVASAGGWLYAVIHGSTTAILLKGGIPRGETEWRWHPIYSWTASEIYGMAIEPASTRYILVGTEDKIVYFNLPEANVDLDNDTNYKFQTGGTLVTPWYNGGLPGVSKAWQNLTVASEQCSTGHYTIGVKYRVTRGGAWITTGLSATSIVTSPSQTIYFGQGVTGTEIQLQFTFTTDDSTTCPILNAFTLEGRSRPTKHKKVQFAIDASEKLGRYAGGMERISVWSRVGTLLALGDETSPVALKDRAATTRYFHFDTRYTIEEDQQGLQPTVWVWFDGTEAKVA